MPRATCDRSYPLLSGWQCYGGWVPGTMVNLLYGSNGAPFDPTTQIGAPNVSPAGIASLVTTRRNPFARHGGQHGGK
jgi:hypothetical protein